MGCDLPSRVEVSKEDLVESIRADKSLYVEDLANWSPLLVDFVEFLLRGVDSPPTKLKTSVSESHPTQHTLMNLSMHF